MKAKGNAKRGISLITLVITIIVVIVLAAAVILTLNNNNPIENAKEAKITHEIATYKESLNFKICNLLTDKSTTEINVMIGEKNNKNEYKIKEYIPEIKDEYAEIFGIENNNLVISKNQTIIKEGFIAGIVEKANNETINLNDTIVQFEDAKQGTEMVVTTTEDTKVTRCGRNLYNLEIIRGANYQQIEKFENGFLLDYNVDRIVVMSNRCVKKDKSYYNSLSYEYIGGFEPQPYTYVTNLNDSQYIAINHTFVSTIESLYFGIYVNHGNDLGKFKIINPQLELGSISHPYESYKGDTYEIKANTPTRITAFDGVNTVFAENGNVNVKYVKNN
ncbi:MAG: hypothetical protein PHP54_04950 [Clostridia bacterium]|nr:hypothetical protein [Clostridia bacterium]